jgi:hypothetical protein
VKIPRSVAERARKRSSAARSRADDHATRQASSVRDARSRDDRGEKGGRGVADRGEHRCADVVAGARAVALKSAEFRPEASTRALATRWASVVRAWRVICCGMSPSAFWMSFTTLCQVTS